MKKTNDLIFDLEQMRDHQEIGDNRAKLASLRRGLGQPPGTVVETSRVVEHLLDEDDFKETRSALYVVAPLFAFHRAAFDGRRSENMGDHFRELCDVNEQPPSNIESRFMALLASEPDDLSDTLRHAVSLLKSKDVAVNWRQLFNDVQEWLKEGVIGEEARQRICLKWSQRFWQLRLAETKTDIEPSKPQSAS